MNRYYSCTQMRGSKKKSSPSRQGQPNIIWLKEFKTFKNKVHVLGHAGIDKELVEMICGCHVPGQLLAVGKLEHKIIIESELNIPCLYDDTVMEVIWGVKKSHEEFIA